MTSEFEINVQYSVPGVFGAIAAYDAECERILAEYGGERSGGGSGFGCRDISFMMDKGFSPQELREIRGKIETATGAKIWLSCEEWPAPTDDEEDPFSIITYPDDPDEP